MSQISPLVNHDEIGRRIDHLAELHWFWSKGLHVFMQGEWHSEWEKTKQKELETALNLLENYMMLGFSSADYAKEINRVTELSKEDKEFFKLPEDFKVSPLAEYKPDKNEEYT